MSKKFLLIGLALVLSLGVVWTAGAQGDDNEQPYLGVAVRLTDDGVQIVNVAPDSPADNAGLQADEFIVSFDGTDVESPQQLIDLVAVRTPGETVTLVIRNDDGERDVEIEIGVRPAVSIDVRPGRDNAGPRNNNGRSGPSIRMFENMQPYQLGVTFRSLTPEIADAEGIDVAEGALVVEVVEDSPADDAGLQEGDVIVAVDGDAVDIEHTLSDRLFAYEAEDRITLEVLRDGETLEIGAVLASDHPARRGMMMFQGNGQNIPFFGPDMHDFEFEGLPDFDFEGMPNFEDFPGLENFRIEVSTEAPTDVEDGFQVLECSHGDFTFYVTAPDQIPATFGCEPYSE